nr:hypothetical protein [uncultured Brevundimonas sp.]
MSDKQVEFLNALEAHAQRAFAKGGQHALHRSGTIVFEGQSVYYKKGTNPEVVTLTVFGEAFDCVLWDA